MSPEDLQELKDLAAAIRAEAARVGATSMAKMSERSGVSLFKIRNIMNGDDKTPIGVYIQLANAFGCKIKYTVER